MNPNDQVAAKEIKEQRFGCLPVLGLVVLAVLITVTLTFWVVKTNIFPTAFQPVTLNAKEEEVLEQKLERLGSLDTPRRAEQVDPSDPLEPEAYTEAGASRLISFTEKELNALLAKNTDWARKLALDLSNNLVSAKLLMPVDEDFPILGGQTIKVTAGLRLTYENGKPLIAIKGINIMGVPMPNAWIGGVKDIDLVKEFGGEEGFWKSFAGGIDNIRVEEGSLRIQLKE